MPLSSSDRRFLRTIDRLKLYLLGLAISIFLFLILTPPSQMHLATSVVGITLCLMFWMTQRLLAVITILDLELSKAIQALKRNLTPEQHRELFHRSG